jgi:predicted permease
VAGAESVSISTNVPPQGGARRAFEIDGRPVEPGTDKPFITTVTISPTFFETVGASIRRGRAFTEADGGAGSENVIVNPQFVAQFFAGEDPIGRRIRFAPNEPSAGQPPPVWRTIIGISSTIRHSRPNDSEPAAVAYIPLRQEPSGFAVLLVRSRVDPSVIMNAVRREVQAIDPDQPVFTVQTLDQMLAQQRWPFRVFGTVFAIFAFIALVLAAVGLYAVMAYSVTQRTQEIGVRMALGAAQKQVSWLVMRRGLVQIAIGLTIGLTGAWFAGQLLTPLLVVPAHDITTFVGISLLLTAVSLAACLIPARRATRLDPLVALRQE